MRNNKVLYIQNLIFNLPDDFTGNLTEALELMIEYRKTDIAKENRKDKLETYPNNLQESADILFDSENTRLVMTVGMSEFNGEVWNDITVDKAFE